MKPLWIVRRLGARVVAIKCCTVPCQRISFARLYSGQTLFPFSCTVRPNWVKNVLIVFFCLVSQTKSFSMSKCIDPWVDEVACSIKNLVSSLNRLFDVLIKICLYLSFSVTLSFLQFIRCCYLQQYLPVSMPALNFTFKILVQSQNHAILELVIGTLCCKTGWKVMLRVLSPTF